MSDTQPTHKVVYNPNLTFQLEGKGYMTEGGYEVVPINFREEEAVAERPPSFVKPDILAEGEKAVEKRGTFEECQAYVYQLNEKMSIKPEESYAQRRDERLDFEELNSD